MEIANLTGEGQFTAGLLRQGGKGFDVFVRGAFTGTVTVQVFIPGIDEWADIDTFTEEGAKTGMLSGAYEIRAGFKAGDYTGGTPTVIVL